MTNEVIFSDMERDVIGEVMNISLGSSATSLSTLLGKRVEITVPKVKVVKAFEFNFEGMEPAIGVEISYVEGLDGVNLMILKRMDAKAIVEILMGLTISDDEFEMDEINTSAICEVMNQMMGSAATALSDFLGKSINISTPIAAEIDDKAEFKNKYFNEEDILVAVSFSLFIEDAVKSEFVNVMPISLAREIVSIFLKGTDAIGEEDESSEEELQIDLSNIEDEAVEDEIIDNSNNDIINHEEEVNENIENKTAVRRNRNSLNIKQRKKESVPINIKPMEYESFDDFEEENLSEEQFSNLELIMSVPLDISVEIGKTKRQIKDILEFSQGTIVELDKQAGALVDIIVNGQLIAKGEVVVVNDNFGVRISEIIKKDEIIRLTL
ncbi:flagellar motor switch phosphatase FliY [Sedimentibacter sp. MB31-C6]|uniref:flagellar motor switch phosphatase FliY n=1 Tax=Sedimentibacter sp. MB31-C6 TaxID=3109366 RepID=UPI002DDD3E4A|nr:flagellar motor switch phosphatase FliY [Sedimentibacter sp. MB36-C1]WSI04983.1 flagellar motor switch phosphatase FliY [Sedimentibacter sp. MB36-C1]